MKAIVIMWYLAMIIFAVWYSAGGPLWAGATAAGSAFTLWVKEIIDWVKL